MSAPPDWLPPLVEFSDYGEWLRYESVIYSHFRTDFLNPSAPVLFRKRSVAIKRHPMIDGREAAFWHCISEGKGEQTRNPDFQRCARIRWLRACIEHENELKVWAEKRNGDTRFHLWLEEEGYLVVLSERKAVQTQTPYLLLWTAFHVRHAHEKIKYARRFANSIKS